MSVNHFAWIALAFAALTGSAAAAALPISADNFASIQGRDVRSEFLPGAYVFSPGASDGGPNTQGSGDAQTAPLDLSPVQNTLFAAVPTAKTEANAVTSPRLISANTSDSDSPGSQGGGAGTNGGGLIDGSPNGVGTVPLPPALPLFGAAVLGLAAFGRSRKRRAASI